MCSSLEPWVMVGSVCVWGVVLMCLILFRHEQWLSESISPVLVNCTVMMKIISKLRPPELTRWTCSVLEGTFRCSAALTSAPGADGNGHEAGESVR